MYWTRVVDAILVGSSVVEGCSGATEERQCGSWLEAFEPVVGTLHNNAATAGGSYLLVSFVVERWGCVWCGVPLVMATFWAISDGDMLIELVGFCVKQRSLNVSLIGSEGVVRDGERDEERAAWSFLYLGWGDAERGTDGGARACCVGINVSLDIVLGDVNMAGWNLGGREILKRDGRTKPGLDILALRVILFLDNNINGRHLRNANGSTATKNQRSQ